MKKILVVTHGALCEGFKSAAEVICGNSEGIDTLRLTVNETLEEMIKKIGCYVEKCSKEDTIFILSDIPIGTTTKSTLPYVMTNEHVYVVSGLNLGLFLSIILTDFGDDPKAELRKCIEESKAHIMLLNDEIEKGEEDVEIITCG